MVTAFAFILAGMAAAPSAEPPIRFAQLILRERVIIRVPARQMPVAPPVMRWKEKSHGRCISVDQIGGAVLTGADRVDFILRGNVRVRAQLESSCPALDYYSGFYLRPGEDGRICISRDAIHSRSGGECQIRRFRQLVPKP